MTFNFVKICLKSYFVDAAAIAKAKRLFQIPNIKHDIDFIADKFSCISIAIDQLQNSKLSLGESLSIVNGVIRKMSILKLHPIGKNVYMQLNTVLKNNPDYSTVKIILK